MKDLENQSEHTTLPSEEESLPHKKMIKDRKRLIIVGGILLCLLFTILFLTTFQQKNQWEISTQSVTPSFAPSQTSQNKNQYETDQTIIANSLDVPPLYPDAQWEDGDKYKNQGLNEISLGVKGSTDVLPFSFSGEFWQTTLPYDEQNTDIEKYYYNELQKRGWFEDGVGILRFSSFELLSPSAGSPCSRTEGHIGYKDGMVRVVTLFYNIIPCTAPGDPTPANKSIDYALFTSELTPIETIVNYIKNNSQ